MNDNGYTIAETLAALVIMGAAMTFMGALVRQQVKVQQQISQTSQAVADLKAITGNDTPTPDHDANCVFDVIARKCR